MCRFYACRRPRERGRRAAPIVEFNAPVWIELYPAHTSGVVVELMGEREAIPEMNLEKPLSTIERARRFCVPV